MDWTRAKIRPCTGSRQGCRGSGVKFERTQYALRVLYPGGTVGREQKGHSFTPTHLFVSQHLLGVSVASVESAYFLPGSGAYGTELLFAPGSERAGQFRFGLLPGAQETGAAPASSHP